MVLHHLTEYVVPVFVWIWLAAQALVIRGGRDERTEILDRPGEGILKVRRWLRGSEESCVDALGMNAANFIRLCDNLEELGLVRSTVGLPAELRVAVCLYMLRKAMTYRTLRDVFQISLRSISMCVHEVLDALVDPAFYNIWVRQPTPENLPLHEDRYTNPKFQELNRRCLGAIDGTHIPANPPDDEASAYRGRHKFLSFNVLCCVTFDGLLCYVYAGWEGSAHDQRVLNSALESGNMKIPDGWYYLADSGYALEPRMLTPYRNTRYHLQEIINSGAGAPATVKELYNLRHSQCRNIIERTYGRLKRKFRILEVGCTLPMDRQVDVIYACCALLNFMTRQGERLDEDRNPPEDGVFPIPGALNSNAANRTRNGNGNDHDDDQRIARAENLNAGALDMKVERDRIAMAMWDQYQAYRGGLRRV